MMELFEKYFNDCYIEDDRHGTFDVYDNDMCFISIEIFDNKCYINDITRNYRFSGTYIIESLNKIFEECNIKTVFLTDMAYINRHFVRLTKLSILTKGVGFYSKFGYKGYNEDEFYEHNNKIRNLTMNQLFSKIDDDNLEGNITEKLDNVSVDYDIILDEGILGYNYMKIVNERFNMNMKVKDVSSIIKEYLKLDYHNDDVLDDYLTILNICMFYIKSDQELVKQF